MPFGQLTHDWTVAAGDWRFGFQEYYWPPMRFFGPSEAISITIIYAGPFNWRVHLSAYTTVSRIIAGLVIAILALAMPIAKCSRTRDGTS